MTAAQASALYRAGASVREIAGRHHLTPHAVRALLNVARVPMRPRGYSPKTFRRLRRDIWPGILRRYDAGESCAAIAASLKVSRQRIHQIVCLCGRKGHHEQGNPNGTRANLRPFTGA